MIFCYFSLKACLRTKLSNEFRGNWNNLGKSREQPRGIWRSGPVNGKLDWSPNSFFPSSLTIKILSWNCIIRRVLWARGPRLLGFKQNLLKKRKKTAASKLHANFILHIGVAPFWDEFPCNPCMALQEHYPGVGSCKRRIFRDLFLSTDSRHARALSAGINGASKWLPTRSLLSQFTVPQFHKM